MDQILIMVLTITANALVTGIIVFIFQKRMESSIIRRNFEHQVKFSKFYNKSLEVIETLRQKMISIQVVVLEFNIELSTILFLWEEKQENSWHKDWVNGQKRENVHNILRDLIKYKDENIIYIPDQYINEISELISQTHYFCAPIYVTEVSTIEKDETYLEPYQTGYLIKMMDITETKAEDMKGLEDGQIAMKLTERLGEKFQAITKGLKKYIRKSLISPLRFKITITFSYAPSALAGTSPKYDMKNSKKHESVEMSYLGEEGWGSGLKAPDCPQGYHFPRV